MVDLFLIVFDQTGLVFVGENNHLNFSLSRGWGDLTHSEDTNQNRSEFLTI